MVVFGEGNAIGDAVALAMALPLMGLFIDPSRRLYRIGRVLLHRYRRLHKDTEPVGARLRELIFRHGPDPYD